MAEVSRVDDWEYQVRVLRNGSVVWQIDSVFARSSVAAEVLVWDGDALLRVTRGGGVGTGVGVHFEQWYHLGDQPHQLLTVPTAGWLMGWGQAFEREYGSTVRVEDGELRVAWWLQLAPYGASRHMKSEGSSSYRWNPNNKDFDLCPTAHRRLWNLWHAGDDGLVLDHFDLLLRHRDDFQDWWPTLLEKCSLDSTRQLVQGLISD